MATKQAKISEEKRALYNENRRRAVKEKKEQRDKEKNEMTTDSRRLGFVRNIIYGRGSNLKSVGRQINMSQQSMSWIFMQDDCYISQIAKMLEAVGVSCSITLLQKNKKKEGDTMTYSFKGNVVIPKSASARPEFITGCTPDKRLFFLAEFFKDLDMTTYQIFSKLQSYRTSFERYFDKDDIKLSVLCKIAKTFDSEIVWDLNSIENEKGGH